MNARTLGSLQTETTPEGKQTLVPGVRPITLCERLALMMVAPLAPRREQKPLNIGLFDEASRAQLDILDFIRTAEGDASSSTQTKE